MTRPRTPAAVLVLALFAAGGLAATEARAGWWDEAGAARPVTLAELRKAPERWRDVPVVLEVRFEQLTGRFNPYFTQFNPMNWQAVTVTPQAKDGARPAPFSHVFVRRGSADHERLREFTTPTPLRVRAVVRDSVGGEPWLEVLRVTGDGDALTPEEAAQVRQAQLFLDKSNPAAAEALVRAVLSARRLPTADRARLHRTLGVALYEQRQLEKALMAFRAAVELDPRDDTAADRAARIETALSASKAPPPPSTARAARPAPEPPEALRKPLYLPSTPTPRLAPPTGLAGSGEPSDSGGLVRPAGLAGGARTGSAPTLPASHTTGPELAWPGLKTPSAAPRVSPQKTPEPPTLPPAPATERLPAPPRPPAPAARSVPIPPAPAGTSRTAPKPAPKPRTEAETPEEEPPAPLPPRPGLAGPK